MADPLSISFEGAARTVTGSRHRIQFGSRSWLFDCGLYQGHRDEAERINRTFRFDPHGLDAVVLSHAHLDHIGNLPTLVSQGFGGRIHATPATADLCRLLLMDSGILMQRDIDHVNRRDRARRPHRQPLYTLADIDATLGRLVTHPYHETWELFPGVTVRYHDAGHILGSAITAFEFKSGDRSQRLIMGGDLGRARRPLLRDPETPPGAQVVVMESTYGNRLHADDASTERDLVATIKRTVARGGRVMVPAFSLGRTQEILITLHRLTRAGIVPELPIFVDSPLSSRTTEVYKRHADLYDEELQREIEGADGAPFGFARLRFVESPDESRALNERREPCIIIAASGMCEGGRILHHLLHGLGDARNTVMFVGFQAEGTLGRRLRDGAETVSIFGEPVRRRAEVVGLDGFSAHADQRELLEWATGLDPAPGRIFLVHGELEAAGELAEKLGERSTATVAIPCRDEEFDLWN